MWPEYSLRPMQFEEAGLEENTEAQMLARFISDVSKINGVEWIAASRDLGSPFVMVGIDALMEAMTQWDIEKRYAALADQWESATWVDAPSVEIVGKDNAGKAEWMVVYDSKGRYLMTISQMKDLFSFQPFKDGLEEIGQMLLRERSV